MHLKQALCEKNFSQFGRASLSTGANAKIVKNTSCGISIILNKQLQKLKIPPLIKMKADEKILSWVLNLNFSFE